MYLFVCLFVCLYMAKVLPTGPGGKPTGGLFDILGSMSRTCALVVQTIPLFRSARTGLISESALFRFVQLGRPTGGPGLQVRVGVGFGRCKVLFSLRNAGFVLNFAFRA